ncbi:MAG: hypothetical protein NTZ33_13820 [Bacteroidetes bacterium]|nr:hypothetical protein [Bacteroidota bacterium]
MARSVIEIKNIIITAKNNEASLAVYVSPSATALFNLWAYIVALAIWTLEVIFDNHKTEINTKIENLIPGTLRWYHAMCLLFQYGDQLSWVNGKFIYQVPDAGKMIVKRVAIREVAGQLRIKVCKEAAGVPVALTNQELISFKSYMSQVKFAGTNMNIISYNACSAKFTLNLVFDPLVLTAAGANISDGIEVVKIALENYLKAIVYGGVINRTKLIDAIQNVPGVVDVYIADFKVKEAAAAVWSTITDQNYESIAGYYQLDTLTLNSSANV